MHCCSPPDILQGVVDWYVTDIYKTTVIFHNSEAIVQYCKDAAAAAPNTPFMYYHIPMVTGINCKLTQKPDVIVVEERFSNVCF